METERLKYFVVIAETGSLTKASQILGISHSGLSKAVSSLEDETRLKLFRPQGRGLEITDEGKWFYQKAQEILKITHEVLQGQKKTSHIIRIGLSEVFAITCAHLISQELQTPISFAETDIGDIEGKLMANEVDFGVAFIPTPKQELEYLEIGSIHFGVYARQDLKVDNLSNLPFTVPISEYPSNPMGYKNRDGWPIDLPRQTKFFVSGFSIALDLLRSGQTALYMPEFVVALENQRITKDQHKIVKIQEYKKAETKRKVYIVKKQSSEESKEIKKVSKILRQICNLKET